jgi:predicted RNase H-like HicB family nuclease
MSQLNFQIEIEQEEDGRWIAEVLDLPGVLAYGTAQKEALAAVQTLAHRVLEDC